MTARNIVLVGAHCVGKTALAKKIASARKLPLLREVARDLLTEGKYPPLRRIAADIDTMTAFQTEIWERQIATELNAQGQYVSDRSIDNLSYAATRARDGLVADLLETEDGQRYLAHVRQCLVFYVRPRVELLENDGVRDQATWESVCQIDGAIGMLLAVLRIRYTPIDALAMADRLRVVDAVCDESLR